VNTRALLDKIAARNTGALGDDIADALDKYCPQYEIDTPLRLAHFLSQACHETQGFRYLKEIWGPTAAQKRYEGRTDLGNTRLGDGRLYCGRGIFQLTGRSNYAQMLKLLLAASLAFAPVEQSDIVFVNYPLVHRVDCSEGRGSAFRVGWSALDQRRSRYLDAPMHDRRGADRRHPAGRGAGLCRARHAGWHSQPLQDQLLGLRSGALVLVGRICQRGVVPNGCRYLRDLRHVAQRNAGSDRGP
jgi:hypothetical protein